MGSNISLHFWLLSYVLRKWELYSNFKKWKNFFNGSVKIIERYTKTETHVDTFSGFCHMELESRLHYNWKKWKNFFYLDYQKTGFETYIV
jgi:hypothetical protein